MAIRSHHHPLAGRAAGAIALVLLLVAGGLALALPASATPIEICSGTSVSGSLPIGQQRDDYEIRGFRGELHSGPLVHLGARAYDPETAQFLTVDPLDGTAGTTTLANRYHYADNNPISRGDPTGMQATDCQIGAACTATPSWALAMSPQAARAIAESLGLRSSVSTTGVWTRLAPWIQAVGPAAVVFPLVTGPTTAFVNDALNQVSDALNPEPAKEDHIPERAPRVVTGPGGRSRTGQQTDDQTCNRSQAPQTPGGDECDPGRMRVQIQWDTSGSNVVYSDAVVASKPAAGVTVAEASAALLRVQAQLPSKASKAAQPAVDRALRWILNRPPSGVSAIGNVHTSYFPYQSFTDARVDIENWHGTNLKS